MFKRASKLNLYFTTAMGCLGVNDLWKLPLTSKSQVSLDSLAIAINNELNAIGDTSFVLDKPSGNSVLELKLAILKEIIADRLKENEDRVSDIKRQQNHDKIKQILEAKQDDKLKDLSEDELKALLKE